MGKMKPRPTFFPLNIPCHSDAKCTVIAVSFSKVLWTCSLQCMSAYTINTNISPINSWPCSEQHEFPTAPLIWNILQTHHQWTDIHRLRWRRLIGQDLAGSLTSSTRCFNFIIMCCISFACKTLHLSEKHFINAMVHSALARMVICLSEL